MRVTHANIDERTSLAFQFTPVCVEAREAGACIFADKQNVTPGEEFCSAVEIYNFCVCLRFMEGIKKAREVFLCE